MVLLVAMCTGCSVFGCGFGGLLIVVFSLLMVLGDIFNWLLDVCLDSLLLRLVCGWLVGLRCSCV